MKNRNDVVPLLSRREALRQIACGFGSVALAGLLAEDVAASEAVEPLREALRGEYRTSLVRVGVALALERIEHALADEGDATMRSGGTAL